MEVSIEKTIYVSKNKAEIGLDYFNTLLIIHSHTTWCNVNVFGDSFVGDSDEKYTFMLYSQYIIILYVILNNQIYIY